MKMVMNSINHLKVYESSCEHFHMATNMNSDTFYRMADFTKEDKTVMLKNTKTLKT